MSEEPQQDESPEPETSQQGGDEPQLTEEQRRLLEEQMREVRVEDLLTQTVASVLNLSARRIVKEDEVDLEQARTGIEAVRALVPLLPPEVSEAIRDPLSQVQMLYAQRSGSAGADDSPGGASGQGPAPGAPSEGPGGTTQGSPGGPSRSGGSGLWTPGSS
jgi:hypothetical protein